jgi:hypothetical protein
MAPSNQPAVSIGLCSLLLGRQSVTAMATAHTGHRRRLGGALFLPRRMEKAANETQSTHIKRNIKRVMPL